MDGGVHHAEGVYTPTSVPFAPLTFPGRSLPTPPRGLSPDLSLQSSRLSWPTFIYLFNFIIIIIFFFFERERESMSGGGAERGTEDLKQALC